MYKELDKYKTGNKIPKDVKIKCSEYSSCPDVTCTIETDEYCFEMGSLLNDFLEHKNKSFFKRKYYHDHLTDIYVRVLNQITLTTYI